VYPDLVERRKFQRLRIKLPLQYRSLEHLPNTNIPSISKDISRGGVCFLCHEFIPISTRVVVIIDLEHSRPTQIKAISKVIWVQKTSSLESYMVGLKFFAMTREDEHSLELFLNSKLA
jgi:c-di-GMP-binding flagellar brake protein YcgR